MHFISHAHVQWRHRRLASVCECGFPEGTSGGEAPRRHAVEVPANVGAGYEERTQVRPRAPEEKAACSASVLVRCMAQALAAM